MTKDVMQAMKERRSVRKFKAEPIPQATIGRLLEAAHWAPSAGNIQPWKFYVVLNPRLKDQLAEAANQKYLAEAPAVIVICAIPKRSASRYAERGSDLYCIQDTAAAAIQLMLAATGFGLGTCWVGAFDETKVSQVLQLPREQRPVVMIPVGYPDEELRPRARYSVDEITHIVD